MRCLPIAATVVTSLLAASAHAQFAVGPVVNPNNGHRYYRTSAMTLAGARAAASQIGGALATIHNATVNDWIRLNVASSGGNTVACSIGLNDIAAEGTFVWESGDPVFYTNWNPGEPNNQGNEDVASISPANGRWNDIPTGILVPAIVEVSGPIRVPAEYPTIQAAINAALDGQTILVAPGTYVGNVDFLYKHLTVRSERGAEQTTIRPTDATYGVVLNGNQGRETVLEGFTVLPATSTNFPIVVGQSQVIRGCRVAGAGVSGVTFWGDGVLSDSLVIGQPYSVAATGCSPTVQNCTLVGGALYLQHNNAAPTIGLVVNSIVRSVLQVESTCLLRMDRCNVRGGWAPGANFDADPGFVNAPGADGVYDLSDDFRLAPHSPCIDAGSASARADMNAVSLSRDLALADRVIDDPDSPGSGIDVGAYEFTPTAPACPIDFNHDGFVDFFDYDDFVAAFEAGC